MLISVKSIAIGVISALMLCYACFGEVTETGFKTSDHEVTVNFPGKPAKILKGLNGGESLTSKRVSGGRTTIYAFTDLGPNLEGRDVMIREYLLGRKDELGSNIHTRKQTLVEDPENGFFSYLVKYKDSYGRKIVAYYDFVEQDNHVFAVAQLTILPQKNEEDSVLKDGAFFQSLKVSASAGKKDTAGCPVRSDDTISEYFKSLS